jgi:hypothetical protein
VLRMRKEPDEWRCASLPPSRVDQEVDVSRHKYKVGQVVDFAQPRLALPTVRGQYEIVRLLPSDGSQFQYRIKAAGESFERMAKESQLTPPSSDDEG